MLMNHKARAPMVLKLWANYNIIFNLNQQANILSQAVGLGVGRMVRII